MEDMVGTAGLEPATSTVSMFAWPILLTTSANVGGRLTPS